MSGKVAISPTLRHETYKHEDCIEKYHGSEQKTKILSVTLNFLTSHFLDFGLNRCEKLICIPFVSEFGGKVLMLSQGNSLGERSERP